MEYLDTVKEIIEDGEIQQEIDCLKTISISITNDCNRKCPYCPHAHPEYDKLDFSYGYMETPTMVKIAERLKELPVHPRITISGNGEPMLHEHIIHFVHMLNDIGYVPTIITNGTIPASKWKFDDGWAKANIVVSVHDMKELNQLKERWPAATFRNHDISHPDCELHATNRRGMAGPIKQISKTCTCPFYKMAIDIHGGYRFCAEDFDPRNFNDLGLNIWEMSIKDYFTKAIEKEKTLLAIQNRQHLHGCADCDIDGTLMGMKYLEWYQNAYVKRTGGPYRPKYQFKSTDSADYGKN